MAKASSLILSTNNLDDTTSYIINNNLLGAMDDKQALALFLRKIARGSQETVRRYKRELVRFSTYITQLFNKKYRDLKVVDIELYIQFLQSTKALEQSKYLLVKKDGTPLFPNVVKHPKSMDQIITVLHSFFNFLFKTGYIVANPAVTYKRQGTKVSYGHKEIQFFYKDEWQCLLNAVNAMPKNSIAHRAEFERTRYILSVAYGGALRQSELVNHGCSNIKSDAQNHNMLHLVGKGKKIRILPVTQHMQNSIRRYCNFLNLTGKFAHIEPSFAPRLYPIKKNNKIINEALEAPIFVSMSARGVRLWFKKLMLYCCEFSEKQGLLIANRLENKSFHSIRHTALSHLAKLMDIEDLAVFAGHESIITTQNYYTPEKNRLKELTQTHGLDFDTYPKH